jgi:RNA polymerase sigma-70 factor (ECF subfamily)
MFANPDNLNEALRNAARGDIQAMALAFEAFRAKLKATVSMRMDSRLNGRFDPSDVVQETFLDARRRFGEFVGEQKMPLFLWFRLLAIQRLVDLHR